jgi:hypothetical protein
LGSVWILVTVGPRCEQLDEGVLLLGTGEILDVIKNVEEVCAVRSFLWCASLGEFTANPIYVCSLFHTAFLAIKVNKKIVTGEMVGG